MPDDPTLVRMLVLDIDGTILRPDGTLSPGVRNAIQAAAARVPTILATARPPRSVRAIAEELGLLSPQVNYNGALLWDPLLRAPIQHTPLTRELCAAMITRTRCLFADALVSVEHLDRWHTDRVDDRYTTETAKLFPPDVITPVETLATIGATKLMFHAKPSEISTLRQMLEAEFEHSVRFIRTDPDLLQMMNRCTSKWLGILQLAWRFGVDASGIMAIGDNENDLEMIQEAGLGIAMNNGTPAAKSAARWIAPSNSEDGVAQAIHRYILTATRE